MFGIYSNQRISKAESKILKAHPDDYNWYCVYVRGIFGDMRFFQVREDIQLPQDDNDNGVVLMFQGGEVVYFKTLEGDITDDEVQSIYNVCSYLEDTFKRPIKAYAVFPPDAKVITGDIDVDGNVTIIFSTMKADNGEEIIERLEAKLKNHEQFTYPDSIDHMLLPYTGFKDRDVFHEKFKNYMALVEEYGG